MKLYVSRYLNPELERTDVAKVGITLGHPRFTLPYEMITRLPELAPSREFFNVEDRDTFEAAMIARLDRHFGFDEIRKILEHVQRRADVEHDTPDVPLVLLCFEDIRTPGVWCHREMVATWWEEKTGERVEEFPDPSTPKEPSRRRGLARRTREEIERMPRLLTAYESRSDPGSFHGVYATDDDELACTCRGWMRHRRCWHVTDELAALNELESTG